MGIDSRQILVISDTHGNIPLALHALSQFPDVAMVVHLGDHYDDAVIIEEIAGRAVLKVPGNCDYERTAPREITFAFEGLSFFMCHGDLYGVKAGLQRLHNRALAAGVDVVLYGHTHLSRIETNDRLIMVNPGCLTRKDPPTCALITVAAGVATPTIHNLAHV